MHALLLARTAADTVATTGADFSDDTWWLVVIKAVAIIVFLLLSVLIAIWFERKVVGLFQTRRHQIVTALRQPAHPKLERARAVGGICD